MRQYLQTATSETVILNVQLLLVTAEQSLAKTNRCGLSRLLDYEENYIYFYLSYLYKNRNEQTDTITLFFRLKSLYYSFFDQLSEEMSRFLRCQETFEVENYIPRIQSTQAILDNKEKQRRLDIYKENIKKRQEFQEQSRQKIAQEVKLLRELEQVQKQRRQKLVVKEQIINKTSESCNINRQQIARDINLLEKQQQQHVFSKNAFTIALTELTTQKQKQKQEEEAIEVHESQLKARER